MLEVQPELRGREVELRFDPKDGAARPRVFLEDRFVCDTVPLDRLRNAYRRRRRSRGDSAPDVEPSGLDPLALIEAEHYERVRPVGAYPLRRSAFHRKTIQQTRRTDPCTDSAFGLTITPCPRMPGARPSSTRALRQRAGASLPATRRRARCLGVLTADAGVRKTVAMRNLCAQLPRPDYLVLYLCDTAVAPLDLYRTLAMEIGVRPSHRRARLWTDLKKALLHMVDERGSSPVIILDEAQHLSVAFLIDVSSFLNFAFDSRDLLIMWLVNLPPLGPSLPARRFHA